VTRALRTSQPAAEEFTEAVRWYEQRRRGLGAEFFDAVCAAIALIETRPEIGTRDSSNAMTRRLLLPKFPYQVVYHLTSTEIVIVAIAHLKRRPGYWKRRP
jgi:plasmid stabilization system protein ParE